MKRVVITGLGVISPIGNDLESYWAGLINGVCGIGPITKFDSSGFKAKLAAEVKGFDFKEYGLDTHAARRMDLYTQYAMAAAMQAATDSGIEGAVAPERLGVYVGSGIGGIHTFAAEVTKLNERGPDRVSPFFIPMMIGNIAAGTIAIKYHAEGPTLPVVTACASATNAIGEAFHTIAHGYADAIFAGGAEASAEPMAVAGFTNMQALCITDNPMEASLPFDKRRKGFVIGEGAGVLLLEEYGHAVNRGARIYAEVSGYGNTCDAHHITAPREDGLCAARAIRLALEEAGFVPEDTVYINAHGTGTPLNDAAETLAIKLALGEDGAKKALISSTKSMTGHLLGAAGAIEVVASALALQRGVVPPTINLLEPDVACDLDYVPNKAREARCTLAISNSFGFGGHNASLALRGVE